MGGICGSDSNENAVNGSIGSRNTVPRDQLEKPLLSSQENVTAGQVLNEGVRKETQETTNAGDKTSGKEIPGEAATYGLIGVSPQETSDNSSTTTTKEGAGHNTMYDVANMGEANMSSTTFNNTTPTNANGKPDNNNAGGVVSPTSDMTTSSKRGSDVSTTMAAANGTYIATVNDVTALTPQQIMLMQQQQQQQQQQQMSNSVYYVPYGGMAPAYPANSQVFAYPAVIGPNGEPIRSNSFGYYPQPQVQQPVAATVGNFDGKDSRRSSKRNSLNDPSKNQQPEHNEATEKDEELSGDEHGKSGHERRRSSRLLRIRSVAKWDEEELEEHEEELRQQMAYLQNKAHSLGP